jgi:hypothetical protein
MEAVPLSDTSAAACSKALTFFWISRFGVPKMITSDRGPQFTSNLWFKLCETLNTSHRQTTVYHPESNRAVQRLHCRLKDVLRARAAAATWSKELPFVLFGLRAQPREDTSLSLVEAVFGAPVVLPNFFIMYFGLQDTKPPPCSLRLCCLMNFRKMKKFLLILLSKMLQKPWMFLLFLCLGIIPAPCCPASFQPSFSPPPLSRSVVVPSSHLSSRSTMAPTPFSAVDPAPSPSKLGPKMRSSPSAASSPARQQTPSLATHVAAADRPVRAQADLPQPSGSCFQTRWYLHLPLWPCLEMVPEPFSYPARRFSHAWDRRRHHRFHRSGTRPVNEHHHKG